MNAAKEMTNFFLNLALMQSFRETDAALLAAFESGELFQAEKFEAAYEFLVAEVVHNVPAAEA